MTVNTSRFMTLEQTAKLIARAAKAQADPSALSPHWGGEKYDNIAAWLDLRRDGKLYSVLVPKWGYSHDTKCVKADANYGLVCEPSTATAAGRDDYRDLHPFEWHHVNGGPDGEDGWTVTAIDGDGMFKRDGSNGNVWVLAPTLWWSYTDTGTHYKLTVCDTPREGLSPQPGAKRPDGTVRPYMLYAAYGGGMYGGKYASVSGVPLRTTDVSYQSLIDICKAAGDGLTSKTHADDWYVKAMFLLKYATKSSQEVFSGCSSYDVQVTPTVAETAVRRVVLANADAAKLLVGSAVMLGNKGSNSGTDRAQSYNHDVTLSARIARVEAYDASNKAVYLDTSESFDTATTQLLSTAPWQTGACDAVQGSDGSPTSCTSGKEPFRIQGIEGSYGAYEIVGNVVLDARDADDGSLREDVYVCYDCDKLVKDGVSADYTATGATLPTAASAGWVWEADVENVGGLLLGVGTGASSSTGTGDATYQNVADSKGYREFLGLGNLWYGLNAGLFCVYGSDWLGRANWRFAGRLSGIRRSAA